MTKEEVKQSNVSSDFKVNQIPEYKHKPLEELFKKFMSNSGITYDSVNTVETTSPNPSKLSSAATSEKISSEKTKEKKKPTTFEKLHDGKKKSAKKEEDFFRNATSKGLNVIKDLVFSSLKSNGCVELMENFFNTFTFL